MSLPRSMLVTRLCRRGCGTQLTTLRKPIHTTQADFDLYHAVCSACLTEDERADMQGDMLMRTARNIVSKL